jgi:vacuolar-type H+-ATPase subunit C/Vma6
MSLLEDALESWLVGRPEAAAAEPYGVAVVFAYLMDFRREVWSLRRLFKAAAIMEQRPAVSGGAS